MHKVSGNDICTAVGDTTYTSDANYKCSDKFTDKIYAHSLLSVSENGNCPLDTMGEKEGAWGYLEFPHGKQSCAVMIGAKCGAPAFELDSGSKNPEDYEIYWAEWDMSLMDNQPQSTFTSSSGALSSD